MLLFRVRWVSVLDYKVLTEVADYVRYDREFKLNVYRLNPVKVAKVGLDKAIKILEKQNIYVPENVIEKIRVIKEKNADVYLDFEGDDLAFYSWSRDFIDYLKSKKLIVWDKRSGLWKAKPSDLNPILSEAGKFKFKVVLGFKLKYSLSFKPVLKVKLRDYQEEAFRKWVANGMRGIIALPVAAGKTLIGLKAIEFLKVKTVVLVPTLDLITQWVSILKDKLGVLEEKIGVFGGGKREVNEITVMTYDSAYINLDKYKTYFGLIIADEAHHSVGPSYRKAFWQITAPFRMGLTATPFRSDGLHKYYPEIIGEIVFSLNHKVLQEKGYLANYVEKKIYVKLSPEDYRKYRELMEKYLSYCRKKIPEVKDPKLRFKRVLELAAKDPEAREALRAKNEARKIALSAERKLEIVEKLLEENPDEKIIIFSRYTDIIREISRKLLIPRILHDTPKDERREILEMFKQGKVRIIATAMALDEGVDVPDASMAIVISGTGSHREYVQRLGRILRPKKDVAKLYEIITKGTIEPSLAWRRRRYQIFFEEE